MPIDFKQGGDTGLDAAASIQPIVNGDPAEETTFQRPDENLRKRTEELKRVVTDNELIHRLLEGMFLKAGGNATCEVLEKTVVNNSDAIPADTGYWFRPDVLSVLGVMAPKVPGQGASLSHATFNNWYSEPANDVEHSLRVEGDSLCLIFPRKGETTSGPEDLEGHNRGTDGGGLGLYWAAFEAGNVDHEDHLVVLPQRVIMNDPNADLLTDYGPAAATKLFLADGTVDGVNQPNGVYLNISLVTGQDDKYWYTTVQGRGGRQDDGGGGTDNDYLKVVKATATTIEVESTTPFRALWPSTSADLVWDLYTKTVGPVVYTGVGAGLINGYVTGKEFKGHLTIPIATYMYNHILFLGGSSGELPIRDAGGAFDTNRATGFTLPYSLYAWTNQNATLEPGQWLGSKSRSSGGNAIASGTISSHLDSLLTLQAGDMKCLATNPAVLTDTQLTDADLSQTFTFPVLPANAVVVSVWVDVLQLFDVADMKAKVGHNIDDDEFMVDFNIGTDFGVVGKFEMAAVTTAYNDYGGNTPEITLSASANVNGAGQGRLRAIVAYHIP